MVIVQLTNLIDSFLTLELLLHCKQTIRLMKKTVLFFLYPSFLFFCLILSTKSVAQEIPFNCDFNAYLFQTNDVYAIDLASGNANLVAANITTGNINAVGYNPTDGYIWGYLSSPSKTIVRIGKNFTTTTYTIPSLVDGSRYVGDIGPDGVYYFKSGGSPYYKIDLNPASASYLQYLGAFELSQSINVHDWAFNAVDGKLYTVEQGTNILYRVHPNTGQVQNLGVVPVLAGNNYTYGAVYFDLSGSFYVSANQTGTVYIVRDVSNLSGLNSMVSNLFAFGPSSSSNDGARCPTAPVPQEICDNGLDDDGDGLADCDDPSCSGYASCPVFAASVSGANEGGLESNNRLSELVNKRNFNRVKKAYTFDAAKAKRVTKPALFSRTQTGSVLRDFIPFGTINEQTVIESTPTDLLSITNASEVYSVDYLKDNKTIATILALKTDDGVYEHTKFICDRLLGAQILSVSTIEINEQPFIKTIIKNADNSIEYVLSFAAKKVNADANFEIESHWNLDKYQKNIGFYNFQIWTNSIDNLYKMGQEVARLLAVQKPISGYNLFEPPKVFVKKGRYVNGVLELQIINTNGTSAVQFDGGLRKTETSQEQKISSNINLDKKLISDITLPTGNLFDIGFRIGDGIATPDDLFLSDGPWGLDAPSSTASVTNYEISANTIPFETSGFAVERNLKLSAATSDYVAAYRALTPRFKAVDLSAYKSLHLKAKGTGTLEIILIKNSISAWEQQYKATIVLTDALQDFAIPLTAFTSSLGSQLIANDIKTIVFKMTATDGKLTVKEMDIQSIQFLTNLTLDTKTFEKDRENSSVVIAPNPVNESTVLQFTSKINEAVAINIYNVNGVVVKSMQFDAKEGFNTVSLSKLQFNPGVYFCIIKGSMFEYDVAKLIVK